MRYDEDIMKQADDFFKLFTVVFGKTKAFRQATSYIYKLFSGEHPALPGRVFTWDELEKSMHNAVGKNKHDARNFFGPDALFNQYLTTDQVQQEEMDITEKLYHSTSKIINLYLQEVNPKCSEEDKKIVRSFLTLLMTDPRVLGYRYKFSLKDIITAVTSYSLNKLNVSVEYRHQIINFFVYKRIVDNYLPKSKMPSGRLCFEPWGA